MAKIEKIGYFCNGKSLQASNQQISVLWNQKDYIVQ